MQPLDIRPLERTDAPALLAFETANRAWFEAHIDPRDPGFYCLAGVAGHIDQYLTAFAQGTWHPLVIVDAKQAIVGRANLKDIDLHTRSAEVGYRVAQHACGQGMATLALQRLIDEARGRWQLTQLVAQVYESNLGSRAVLQRAGFVPGAEGFVLTL